MYITIPLVKENSDDLLTFSNGQSLTLRISPFDADTYSLSAVDSLNGTYETTQSITASGTYRLYKNGVWDKSYGGNNGQYLISESNLLDVNSFNVGDTLVCQSISGTKYFVPTSLTSSLNTYVQSGTANNNLLQWSSTANAYYSKSLKQVQGYRSYCAKLYQYFIPVSDEYDTFLTENLYYNQFYTGVTVWTKQDTGKFYTITNNELSFSSSANVIGYGLYNPVYNPNYELIGYYKLTLVNNKVGIETYNPTFDLTDGIFADGCVVEIKTTN